MSRLLIAFCFVVFSTFDFGAADSCYECTYFNLGSDIPQAAVQGLTSQKTCKDPFSEKALTSAEKTAITAKTNGVVRMDCVRCGKGKLSKGDQYIVARACVTDTNECNAEGDLYSATFLQILKDAGYKVHNSCCEGSRCNDSTRLGAPLVLILLTSLLLTLCM